MQLIKVAMVSSTHDYYDARIIDREGLSLLKAGYEVLHFYKEKTSKLPFIHKGILMIPIRPERFIFSLIDSLRAHQVKVIHLHDLDLLLEIKRFKRHLPNAKIIYDAHEFYPETILARNSENAINNFKKRVFAKIIQFQEPYLALWADAVFVSANLLLKRFKNSNKIYVPNFRVNSNETDNEVEKTIDFLYLGSVSEQRGITDLVIAGIRLHQKNINFKLIILGFRKDKLKESLVKLIHESSSEEKILLIDEIPPSECEAYLNKAHLGIVPFRNLPKFQVSISAKLFDYAAYKMHIISSDLESVRLLFSDSVHYFIPGNIEDLASKMEAALNNIRGENLPPKYLADNLGFNWAYIEPKMLEVYKSILPK